MDNGGGGGGGAIGLVFSLIWLVVMLAMIVGNWMIFTKAGEPGWAIFIPIYNFVVLLKICGKPAWWIILSFIPLVNIAIALMITVELAARFGKGIGYAIGMIFLPFIFIPMLGFSDAQYQGSKGW